MGAGPSVLEFYCKISDSFIGAHVQGAGDEEVLEDDIEVEEAFEEQTGEEDVVEEQTEHDEFLEDSGIKRSIEEIGGKEAFNGGKKDEDFVEDETPNLQSPQSLWPLPPTFWNGFVPGREQGLLPRSPTQVDHNEYLGYLNEPSMIDNQSSVTAVQHAHCAIAQSSLLESRKRYNIPRLRANARLQKNFQILARMPTLQSPTKGTPPLCLDLADSPFDIPRGRIQPHPQGKLHLLGSLQHQRHGLEFGHKRAAVGKAKLSQQPSAKKDSRSWGEHEKARVKTLMLEVISESTHASTEERWKVISRRLSRRYSIDRTWTAVKK